MIDLLYFLLCFSIFIVLQSLFINGYRDLFNDGMILYKLRLLIDKNVNEFWRKPIYSCVKCLSSTIGTFTFLSASIYLFGLRWEEIPLLIFDIVILVYANYFFYKRQ